ncbi:MAG: ATP-binding cassette domain-containing protein [Candidatus Enteromonas sp.]|nr:ATP-binding cassette domain-containing protein [Candidatus Enteromonas sp.]
MNKQKKTPSVTFDQSLVDNHVILSVRHLKEYFAQGDYKTKAVHDVSFDVKEGECFGLVGESGCGKTTTGRSVIGLYKPTSGAIYYKGYRIAAGTRYYEKEIKWSRIHAKEKIAELRKQMQEDLSDASSAEDATAIKARYLGEIDSIKKDLEKHIAEVKEKLKRIAYDNKHSPKKLRQEIQMIFQDPIDSLDPRMTVEDIIAEGLHIQGQYNQAKNREVVSQILSKVGLIPEYASRYPHEFSGGQRQRIGIARALVMNPRVLICDEPISALDVSIRAQVLNLLNEVKEEMNLTMLFIAHDLSVVKYFCDRIAVMYFGNMVELATSDELFAHPLHPYTKALLSAIPKPDPESEKSRVRLVYHPESDHDYSKQKPTFREIAPGHFVLCNDEEEAAYKAQMEGGEAK